MRCVADEMLAMIQPTLFTRPRHVEDKRGKAGRPISLATNYIPIQATPDWTLYQYHVHFNPPVDSKFVRLFLSSKYPSPVLSL